VNKIKAKVTKILNEGNLNIAFFKVGDITLEMVSLELDDIKIDDNVLLNINPSHITISKDNAANSSHSNIIYSKIVDIEKGNLLSVVKLEIANNTFLDALLTTKSVEKLSLQLDENVYALINASEISIGKKI
jgi:molybdopterin-binding protein